MTKLETIIGKQIEFQKLVGFPIETNVESVRNELAEKYLFKMIEETVELRREFPSVMNPWSKHQKIADIKRIKEEFSDVILFLMNFMITFKLSPEEMLQELESTQENNFTKIKINLMNVLNQDILKVKNYVSGIGQGSLTPDYVVIGVNPSNRITHGYRFWSDPKDGSSKILLPALEFLGKNVYFTNTVKSTTGSDSEPSEELTDFWKEFLKREIEILKANNPNMKIITLGRWVDEHLSEYPHIAIKHPAYVLRGGMTKEEYESEIKKAITSSN